MKKSLSNLKNIIKDIIIIIISGVSIFCLAYPIIIFWINPLYNINKESYIKLIENFKNFYMIGILCYIIIIMYIKNDR